MVRNISFNFSYHFNKTQVNNNNHFNIDLHIIFFYIMCITIPVGIIGNLASIFIFTRRSLNQRTNTGFLFTIFCILNIIRIVIQATFNEWGNFLEYTFKLPLSGEKYIESVMFQTVSWTQALISFDRFVIVLFPIKGVRILSKKWVLYLIMAGLLALILSVNATSFIHTTIYYLDSKNQTHSFPVQQDRLVNVIVRWTRVLMEVHIPYIIMVILDILVIVRLKRSKIRISGDRQTNRSSRFTINTILIDLIYLIFHFPFTIFHVYFVVTYFNEIGGNYYAKVLMFVYNIVLVFPFIYSCFVFFVFVVFNRNFRSELFSIGFMLKLKRIFVSRTVSSQIQMQTTSKK